jgi:4'-phosphopantetheinyl transferase
MAIGSPYPVSQIFFEETGNGRPYLSGLADTWFSFSSCHSGFLGAWSSTHAIGVDIENQTEIVEARELAKQFFSTDEAGIVNRTSEAERQRIFLQFWSLKEAALKSIGEGLPFGLENFQFKLHPKPRVVHAPASHGGHGQFEAHAIPGIDACAALVIRNLNCKLPDHSQGRTHLYLK